MTEDAPIDFEDVTEKRLLAAILAELQAQRKGEPEETRYRCDLCRDVVLEDEREQHLVEDHGAPVGLDPEEDFERVER